MTLSGWENFFLAQVGASAALTGLIFVGVSINLEKIIANPALPSRALEALMLLVTVLIISSLLLVPQSWTAIGIEVLVVGVLAWGTNTYLQVNSWRKLEVQYRRAFLRQIAVNQVATLLLIVAGVLTLIQEANGLYWLVPSFIFCIFSALLDAWVLLIEINR